VVPCRREERGLVDPERSHLAHPFGSSTRGVPWTASTSRAYLNEFVFRFNRRNSRSRGLVFHRILELAVDHDPVRYRHLVARPRPRNEAPKPPGATGHPPSG